MIRFRATLMSAAAVFLCAAADAGPSSGMRGSGPGAPPSLTNPFPARRTARRRRRRASPSYSSTDPWQGSAECISVGDTDGDPDEGSVQISGQSQADCAASAQSACQSLLDGDESGINASGASCSCTGTSCSTTPPVTPPPVTPPAPPAAPSGPTAIVPPAYMALAAGGTNAPGAAISGGVNGFATLNPAGAVAGQGFFSWNYAQFFQSWWDYAACLSALASNPNDPCGAYMTQTQANSLAAYYKQLAQQQEASPPRGCQSNDPPCPASLTASQWQTIEQALQAQMGDAYVNGAKGAGGSTDCSGFVASGDPGYFNQANYDQTLPDCSFADCGEKETKEQLNLLEQTGQESITDAGDLQPGDVAYFSTQPGDGDTLEHVVQIVTPPAPYTDANGNPTGQLVVTVASANSVSGSVSQHNLILTPDGSGGYFYHYPGGIQYFFEGGTPKVK